MSLFMCFWGETLKATHTGSCSQTMQYKWDIYSKYRCGKKKKKKKPPAARRHAPTSTSVIYCHLVEPYSRSRSTAFAGAAGSVSQSWQPCVTFENLSGSFRLTLRALEQTWKRWMKLLPEWKPESIRAKMTWRARTQKLRASVRKARVRLKTKNEPRRRNEVKAKGGMRSGDKGSRAVIRRANLSS